MSSALEGVAPRRSSRRARASERATCWTSWRERCYRSGRARQRDAAVRFVAPSAPDNAMQSPGALLQCVAAVRRAADAVASIFWCSLLSPASTLCTAGAALAAIGSPAQLSVQSTTSPLFVRKPPRGAVGSPLPSTSCVSKKIFRYPKSAAQRLAVAWTSCLGAPLRGRRPVRWRPGGQPAGCVDVQNAIARQRAWLKGCPPGAGHSRLGGRRRSGAPSWTPPRL